ncbi:MAG TPA: 2-oxoacid:ferredoxin oxidoreductase subunit gamma [Candidatus Cloacimonetes bacterium]|nr:2-oxoacid:ferredoxin oxidoreductase subunit gamma [Candidatus Cloacimonadota bacterium]
MKNNNEFKKELRLSGSGGQGLITAGIILAQAAIRDKYIVTQTQTYGPESRGGASRADVIIGNTEFYFPEATRFDILMTLTQEAYDKYSENLKDNGILIADTTFVKNITLLDSEIYELPFTEIALEKLKTELPTNILAISFLIRKTKVVSESSLKKAITESMKPQYLDLNLKAMKLGFKLADEYVSEE